MSDVRGAYTRMAKHAGIARRHPHMLHHAAASLLSAARGSTAVRDDVPLTTIERTLVDGARSSDRSLVREAVHEALERGLTTRRRLALALGDIQEGRTQIRHTWGVRLSRAETARRAHARTSTPSG